MIKKQLLLFLIILSSLVGYSQTITPQWKAGVGYILVYYPGKSPAGYDSLYYLQSLRSIFKNKGDTTNNDGYVTVWHYNHYNHATGAFFIRNISDQSQDSTQSAGYNINGDAVFWKGIGHGIYNGNGVYLFNPGDSITYSQSNHQETYYDPTGVVYDKTINNRDTTRITGNQPVQYEQELLSKTTPVNNYDVVNKQYVDSHLLSDAIKNQPDDSIDSAQNASYNITGNGIYNGYGGLKKSTLNANGLEFDNIGTGQRLILQESLLALTDSAHTYSTFRMSHFVGDDSVKVSGQIPLVIQQQLLSKHTPANQYDVLRLKDLPDGVIGGSYSKTQTDSVAVLKQDTSRTEHFLGQLFARNAFTSTSGFTDVSSGVTVSGGVLNFATGSGDNTYIKQLQVTGNTALEKYRIIARFVVGEKSATSYGFALGTQSTYSGTGKINIAGKFDMTNAGTSGQVSLVGADITNLYPTLTTSTSAVTFSVGDTIELITERFINKFTVSARNVTTGSAYVATTTTMKFNGSAGIFQPNMGQFAIYNLGGAFKTTGLTVTSREVKNPSVAMITDSKGRFGTQFITSNVGTLLGITNNSVVMESGRGNTTSDMITLIPEILSINPKYAILSFSSNDVRGSVYPSVYKANYSQLVDSLVAHGITVFHTTPLYEPTLDQTSMASYIATTYPNNIINVPIVSSDLVDGVHLNEAGMLKWFNSITDAVKIQQGGKNETLKFILDQSNTLLTGLAGSQTVIGGAAASENLTLTSTASSTKGSIYFGSAQTTRFDEGPNWLGIKSTPTHSITLGSTTNGFANYNTVDQTTNLERATWSWVSNVYTLNVAAAGTGTQRPLAIKLNSGRTFTINTVPTTLPTFQFGAGTSGAGAALGVDGTYNASALRQYMNGAAPTISQSGSAGSTILYAYPFYNSVGSGGDYLLGLGFSTAADLGGTLSHIFRIKSNGLFQFNGTDFTANQVPGANSGATGMEAKTITGSAATGQVVTHGTGIITLSNDTTIVSTKANSYTLSAMQTKLNNYASTLVDNILSKTADYTIVSGDFVSGKKTTLDLYVDATAGNVTITLPSAATFAGYTIYVTKTDASANTITINTLLGGNSITSQYQVKQCNSNATSWYNH